MNFPYGSLYTSYLNSKYFSVLLLILVLLSSIKLVAQANEEDSLMTGAVWIPDNGDGTYNNPIIYADYSDPDVVRTGEDFYMVSSSFNCVPGIPVFHSKDLVNWTLIGHVFNNQPPLDVYDEPGHGVGVWAPSIRFHNGEYYVYYADPDYGIYQARATDPAGPWEHKLVQQSYGWIDPCPFWDDNDSAYLVHAYAKSRVGFNSILTLRRMSQDGETISLTDTIVLFDGNDPDHPRVTIEGPKMYKRNGYYYVFAPFGGVENGEQAVLRSDNIFGPYKDTTVLEKGLTNINGPHQGGWVELESGESWFVHFQEKLPYGRIVHLQPVEWINDWPFMGEDHDGDGIGEPVSSHVKPDVGQTYSIQNPQTTDKFDSIETGLQWQWHSNFDSTWWSLTDNPGSLRLIAAQRPADYVNLWDVGSMILQKLPAPKFSVTTRVELNLKPGETAGLVVMGQRYTYIGITETETGRIIRQRQCTDARNGSSETTTRDSEFPFEGSSVYLRVSVDFGGKCRVSYSTDGVRYHAIGTTFTTDEGRWIGAKVGLFCQRPYGNQGEPGFADFNWFNVDYFYNRLPLAATSPFPGDGDSEIIDSNFGLSWEGDEVFTDSFDVYLDTKDEPEILVSSQKNSAYIPHSLIKGQTYYWCVDSKNDKGTTKGTVWKFTATDIQTGMIPNSGTGLKLELRPNLLSEYARIDFSIRKSSEVNIRLYNVNGTLVRVIADERFSSGNHSLPFEHDDLPAGIYLLKMEASGNSISSKIVIH